MVLGLLTKHIIEDFDCDTQKGLKKNSVLVSISYVDFERRKQKKKGGEEMGSPISIRVAHCWQQHWHCQNGTVAPNLILMKLKETVDNMLEEKWSKRQGYHSVNTWLICSYKIITLCTIKYFLSNSSVHPISAKHKTSLHLRLDRISNPTQSITD